MTFLQVGHEPLKAKWVWCTLTPVKSMKMKEPPSCVKWTTMNNVWFSYLKANIIPIHLQSIGLVLTTSWFWVGLSHLSLQLTEARRSNVLKWCVKKKSPNLSLCTHDPTLHAIPSLRPSCHTLRNVWLVRQNLAICHFWPKLCNHLPYLPTTPHPPKSAPPPGSLYPSLSPFLQR